MNAVQIEKIVRKKGARNFSQWPPLYFYARGKLAFDPAYPLVAQKMKNAPGPILDIGCGMGLLTAYLREAGLKQAILGMDTDAKKIEIAQNNIASNYNESSFSVGNADCLPDFLGSIVMLDVLHYFDNHSQKRLLEDITKRVAPGGLVIIRTAIHEPNWRYLMTILEEVFTRISGWIPVTTHCNFPKSDTIKEPFLAKGFTAQVSPMWGLTPFNSYLFEFQRK